MSTLSRENSIRKAIIRTLFYSDLFEFPLTQQELWRFLKSSHPITNTAFLRELQILCKQQIIHAPPFYALKKPKVPYQ
jgi:hypothetical protein